MICKSYSLNDICARITDGSHFSPPDDSASTIPMLSVKDMREYDFDYTSCKHVSRDIFEELKRNDCVPQKDDILVAKDGSYLKEIFVNTETTDKAILSSIAIFRPNQEIVLPKFLCYLLKSPKVMRYTKDNCVSGSALPRIVLKAFRSIQLDVPDLITQKKVVRALSTLDQKIKVNNELINSLYSLGDAIYETVHDGDSETVTLKDVSVNYDKKRIPLSSRQRSERRGIFPYYGATSILDYIDDYIFDGEYVLLGEDGTVVTDKGGAVLQYIWGRNWVNNHAHVLQGNTVSTEYLLFALRSVNVSALVTGAVQPKINQENMNKIKLSVGSSDEMVKAEKSIKIIAAQIRNLTDENRTLSELRDSLLPKLLSGEINLNKVQLS